MILKLKMILVVVVHHLRLNFQGKVLRKLYPHSCLGTGYFLKTTLVKKLHFPKKLHGAASGGPQAPPSIFHRSKNRWGRWSEKFAFRFSGI